MGMVCFGGPGSRAVVECLGLGMGPGLGQAAEVGALPRAVRWPPRVRLPALVLALSRAWPCRALAVAQGQGGSAMLRWGLHTAVTTTADGSSGTGGPGKNDQAS